MTLPKAASPAALVTEQDLPIQDYDKQGAEVIARTLKGFSQRELRTIDVRTIDA